jgi:hypothetical protein
MQRSSSPLNRTKEIRDESEAVARSFKAARHRLHSAVFARPGDAQSGELAPAIWTALPALDLDSPGQAEGVWKLPVYNTIWHMIRNPMYAGAYAFGKTGTRTKVIDGPARKSDGHCKPVDSWMVLIRDHHSGYIAWEQFERNQMMLTDNAHMKSRMEPKADRGGRILLAGLLRCRRCGRMLHVAYSGSHGEVPRYHCRGAHINHGGDWCISFGGPKARPCHCGRDLEGCGRQRHRGGFGDCGT